MIKELYKKAIEQKIEIIYKDIKEGTWKQRENSVTDIVGKIEKLIILLNKYGNIKIENLLMGD